MSFCGQCGYLLAPNSVRCPRCGARIETPGKEVEETHSDAPTIHSQPGNIPPADYLTWQSISQQETALRARNDGFNENTDATGPYDSAPASEQTLTPHGPAGSFYPPQTPPYPAFPAENEHIYRAQKGETSYPSMLTSPTTDYPQRPYPTTPPASSKKSSTALILAIIAFVLAAALTTTLLFIKPQILQQISQQHTTTPTVIAPSPTAVTLTPEQHAQMVIERYFAAINRKAYRAAYNLWAPPPSSYNDFANGFTHTRRDDIQLGTLTQQNDGTVQVPIIITALTDTGTKEAFSGYYIVGQQPDRSWKITGAKINPGTGS